MGRLPMGHEGDGVAGPAPDRVAPEPPAGFVSCDQTIERLYYYLDGELTEQRRIEISRHLDLCGPCVGAYGFEQELRKLVANRCQDHVPDALRDRVARALSEESAAAAD